MKFQQWPKRDPNKNYFMVPNEVFHIDLSHPKISIYCYLLSIEDRETYQCWPSYKTCLLYTYRTMPECLQN